MSVPNARRVPRPDSAPEDVPDWATADAWSDAERTVELARRHYHNIASKLPPELRGQFIAIDSEQADCYVIGQTEADADAKFRREYPDRRGALFEIGCVSI